MATKLDVFDEVSGQYPAMLVATKPCVFEETPGDFPAVLVAP